MNVTYRQEALELMGQLCIDMSSRLGASVHVVGSSDYVAQRSTIQRIFDLTGGASYNSQSIVLRLTVIDSLYSTNAAYSYYAIDSMADAIAALGTERNVADSFYAIACGKVDEKNLFGEKYGLHKNLTVGNQQLSLMSKYAYYALLHAPASYPLGFPIYDSLVKKMYPIVCRHLCINIKKKTFSSTDIERYVKALDEVRTTFFGGIPTLYHGFQQFDVLDAYLWRMGKLDGGNYSLLLDQQDYSTFVKNLGLDQSPQPKDFTAEVRKRCLDMDTPLIVKNLKAATLMQNLIDHWKTYFAKHQ